MFLLVLLLSLFSFNAMAYDLIPPANSERVAYPGVLLSQFEENDAYDPFVDYSEFEEATEEEADINFFRNGRFFTLGFVLGYRTFTDTLGEIYSPAPNFGLFLSYFFDLRFAMQLTFLTGDHNIALNSQGVRVRGNASLTSFGLNLKYYINTQNVTKGLASINPYLTGGLANISRTATIKEESAFGKESATAFEIGGGIELPLMRNKMYFGVQATYQMVNFADENTEITLSNNSIRTGRYPTGDIVNITSVLGVNF
ncbi:MAG: outer membrane beta-barrel protein [Bdellovibrionales bacterium]|nr:outer membrane beta-barrel protein [Bdellovibrionales bacterium]